MANPELRRILPLFLASLLMAAIAEAVTLKEPFNRTLALRSGSELSLRNVNGGVTVERSAGRTSTPMASRSATSSSCLSLQSPKPLARTSSAVCG